MNIAGTYQPRFVSGSQLSELVDLYHLARTALVSEQPNQGRRMVWAAAEFHRLYPEVSEIAAYKDLSGTLEY